MKVSVITCTYNSEDTVEDSILSFLEQDHPDKELVVIDGASSDKTLEILEKHRDKIDVLISEKDNGIYNAMNKGLKKITGELFGFLHSDDIYSGSGVLSAVNAKVEETNCDVLYGDLVYTDKSARKVIRSWKSGEFNRKAFKRGWMPPHPSLYMRTELLEKKGGFNEAFRISGDYEFMLRYLYLMETKVAYLPQVLVKMRVGGESNQSLSNRLKANTEDRKAWRINGLNPFPATSLKPARKIFQFLGN